MFEKKRNKNGDGDEGNRRRGCMHENEKGRSVGVNSHRFVTNFHSPTYITVTAIAAAATMAAF